MNKTLTTAALPTLGASRYVSPEAKVTEIHPEGVLCTSGQIEQWTEKTIEWE